MESKEGLFGSGTTSFQEKKKLVKIPGEKTLVSLGKGKPEAIDLLSAYVVSGMQKQAQLLLQENPHLAKMKTNIVDHAGREFKQIRVLQYAIWALDWRMWSMILKYLTPEEACTQFKEWQDDHQHGLYFDFDCLLHQYQIYNKLCNNGRKSFMSKQSFADGIGNAQKRCPVHILQEFMAADQEFSKSTDFSKPIRPTEHPKYSVRWALTARYCGGKLGQGFALERATEKDAQGKDVLRMCAQKYGQKSEGVEAAFKALFERRLCDWRALESKLLEQCKDERNIDDMSSSLLTMSK